MLTDMRAGMRECRRHPASTAAIVAVMAAGLGVGTAVFSALNEALLRMPAGVADPGSVITLQRHSVEEGYRGFTHRGFVEYREAARSLAVMAAARPARLLLNDGSATTAVEGMLVTEGYLPLLGVPLAVGRHFRPEEEAAPGAHAVVILAHRLWRGRFAGDPDIVGRTMVLNGAAFTIVGVAERGFEGLDVAQRVDVWLPLALEERARPLFPALNSDLFAVLHAVARLRPGVSLAQARAELAALALQLETEAPAGARGWRVIVSGDAGRAGTEWRRFVLSWSLPLSAGAALLLILVIGNAAGVLLARSLARRRELAVRFALGARRWRVLRQFTTETLVLAVPVALVGLLVARGVAVIMARAVPGLQLTTDHRVLGFAALVTLVACCLAALLPALGVNPGDLGRDLRDQGGATRPTPLWRAIIAAQVALSLVLLTAASLLVQSVRAESATNPGFAADRVLLAELDLRLAGYGTADARALHRRLLEELAATAGVASVSAASAPPLDRGFDWAPRPVLPDDDGPAITVQRNAVAPGYLDVLGVGIVAGRDLGAGDTHAVVVNEAFAARLGPGPVLGRTLRFPTLVGPGEPHEIVGIMRNVRVASRGASVEPEVLLPLTTSSDPGIVLIFRPAGEPAAAAKAATAVIRSLVPELPPPPIESVRTRRDRDLADERLYARLTTLFGLIGVLTAALGLFGAVSFDVARRRREFGIRLALGASPARIRWLALRDNGLTLSAGVGLGLVGSVLAARLLRSVLHGVAPTDPAAFAVATAVLLACAGGTAWLSTRRMDSIEPMDVLR